MEAGVLEPIAPGELRALQRRSDGRGLLRLSGHMAVMIVSASALGASLSGHRWWVAAPALLLYGFTLVSMFACMHEAVHRTSFKTAWLNNSVGWVAALLSFYNSTFYRHYHGWHHRFTQIEGKDPELGDPKPKSLPGYVLEMSGLPWWAGKIKTYFKICLGRVADYPFLNSKTGPQVVRSVRLQMGVYLAALVLSALLWQPLFFVYWFIPVLVAQPILRGLLLAEHGECSHDDNPMTNTRTTYTVWPVRFLMWDMPYHAEHHRYPAMPFFALARAHRYLVPHLAHVGVHGYVGVHLGFLRHLRRLRKSSTRRPV